MTAVVIGERHLVHRFEAVVQFAGDALFHLGDHVVGVQPAEALAQDGTEQIGIAQVGSDGIAHAGILHLHRDGTLAARRWIDDNGAMHLADAGRRQRLRIPLDEQFYWSFAQLAFDDVGCQLGAHRWRIRLQLRQRLAQGAGQTFVDVAGHLAQLHQRTLHVAQAFGDRLGSLQFALVVQFEAAFGRCEHLARCS